MRNSMNAQEVAVGWWPGDGRYPKAAFYAYAHPAPAGFADATLAPAAARWDPSLREDNSHWDDICARPGPARGRARVRAIRGSTCLLDLQLGSELAASAEGASPPIN